MSYCVKETKLLQKAGRELAIKLLPSAFRLRYSSHDTGCQMTINTATESGQLAVWKGSRWYSHSYEFNDRNDIPGIQPDFEFAAPIIEKYFRDVGEAVAAREATKALKAAEQRASKDVSRQSIVAATRRALGIKPQ